MKIVEVLSTVGGPLVVLGVSVLAFLLASYLKRDRTLYIRSSRREVELDASGHERGRLWRILVQKFWGFIQGLSALLGIASFGLQIASMYGWL